MDCSKLLHCHGMVSFGGDSSNIEVYLTFTLTLRSAHLYNPTLPISSSYIILYLTFRTRVWISLKLQIGWMSKGIKPQQGKSSEVGMCIPYWKNTGLEFFELRRTQLQNCLSSICILLIRHSSTKPNFNSSPLCVILTVWNDCCQFCSVFCFLYQSYLDVCLVVVV